MKEEPVTDLHWRHQTCRAENQRMRAALQRIRNALHAHNRPDAPLSNEKRIALRDIADLALEAESVTGREPNPT
jgi:hypothetical protein